jgi:hypothetical protein
MPDAFKDDPWIAANSEIAAAKLHALGVINYRWNTADVSLKSLLIGLTGAEFFKIWAIIHEMGDRAISTAASEIMLWSNIPQPVVTATEFGLKLYDANRINRNQLTHFAPAQIAGSDLARLKGPRFHPQPFPDSIEDLRRVASDMADLLNYFSKLITVVYSRQYSQKPGGTLPPLPDIIPLPEMVWRPPPPNAQAQSGEPDKAPTERSASVLRLTEEEWLAKYRKEGRPIPDGSA